MHDVVWSCNSMALVQNFMKIDKLFQKLTWKGDT